MKTCRLVCGDALEVLRGLDAGSVDAVITDPPYPCIQRDYGYWTEAGWFAMVNPVVEQCRRVLKPTGSAVFILQPNSERLGWMRTWLWRFMLHWGEEWGQVQDAWWWNHAAMPCAGATTAGLLRGSLKACIWLGPADCWRDQEAVLWEESERQQVLRLTERAEYRTYPSGHSKDNRRMYAAAVERGGVTPFNVLPVPNTRIDCGGHGAGTPNSLIDWWVRYIAPEGGTVLDPFAGSGTVPAEALRLGRSAIGIDRQADYIRMAERRCREAAAEMALFEPWEISVEGVGDGAA